MLSSPTPSSPILQWVTAEAQGKLGICSDGYWVPDLSVVVRLCSKTAKCSVIVLQYDIYSIWGGDDQKRPQYLQRQRSRTNSAQLQHNYRRGSGLGPSAFWSAASKGMKAQHPPASSTAAQLLQCPHHCLGLWQGSEPHTPAAAVHAPAAWSRVRSLLPCSQLNACILIIVCASAAARNQVPAIQEGYGIHSTSWVLCPWQCNCIFGSHGGGPVPVLICLQCSLGAQTLVWVQDHTDPTAHSTGAHHVSSATQPEDQHLWHWHLLLTLAALPGYLCHHALQHHQGQRSATSTCGILGVFVPLTSTSESAQAHGLLHP